MAKKNKNKIKKSISEKQNDFSVEKKVAKHLKKLEEKLSYYKQVVKSSSDAIIIQDFNGIVKAWNKGAEKIYGFKEGEILGKSILKIISKKDRAKAQKNIVNIKKGKPSFRIRQTRITKKGEEIILIITYSPIYEKEEIIEIGMVEQDVTLVEEHIKNLEKEKEKAEKYLDISPSIIMSLNKKGEITLLNRKGCKILGCGKIPCGLIGKNWFDCCLSQDNIKEVKKVFKDLISGNGKMVEFYENSVQTKKMARELFFGTIAY